MEATTQTLESIKTEMESKQSQILKKFGVFFAYSDDQFTQNKTPKKEGDKYMSLGGGGYMPTSNLKSYLTETSELRKWYKDQINRNKEIRRANIAYELSNHECYYTGSIEAAVSALGSDYTYKEVYKVYKKEAKAWQG